MRAEDVQYLVGAIASRPIVKGNGNTWPRCNAIKCLGG